MKVLLVDNGTSYLPNLQALTTDYRVDTIPYTQLSSFPLDNYDLIILSGGHQFSVIGHEDKFISEINLIKNTTVPILGICLGFELIGHAYGAKLSKLKAKEINILSINPHAVNPLFTGIESFEVYESHRWVIADPGDNLIALASSKDGIEIIKHKDKLIYGFQFHPEMFLESTVGDELFANFIKIVQNKHI